MNTSNRYAELFELTHLLLEERGDELYSTPQKPYSHDVHRYISRDSYYGFKKEIMLPLPKENWPKSFNGLYEFYAAELKPWPQYSFYGYTMDCLTSNVHITQNITSVNNPCFGYAIIDKKLIPCSFITLLQMTREIEGMDSMVPEYWVFDPIALTSGYNPDCYIGISPPINLIRDWSLSRSPVNQLLEETIEQQKSYK